MDRLSLVPASKPRPTTAASAGAGGRAVGYLEWSWDPDPSDGWAVTEYAFLLRDPDGRVRTVHETHRLGLFSRADWLRPLLDTGFQAKAGARDHLREPAAPHGVRGAPAGVVTYSVREAAPADLAAWCGC